MFVPSQQNKKPSIILLHGVPNAGRKTAAKHLTETYGFQEIRFRDPVKEEVAKKYGLLVSDFDNQKAKTKILADQAVKVGDAVSKAAVENFAEYFKTRDGKKPSAVNSMIYKTNGGVLLKETPLTDRGEDAMLVMDIGNLYHTPTSLLLMEESIGRALDPSHWVTKAFAGKTIKGDVVVSDFNYPFELHYIARCFGALYDVRSVLIHPRYVDNDKNKSIEDPLKSWAFDYILPNNTDEISNFHVNIDVMMEYYKFKPLTSML